MTDEPISLGALIRRARKELGYNQHDLAAAAGIHKSQVSRWERGATTPERPSLQRLYNVLHTHLEQHNTRRAFIAAAAGMGIALTVADSLSSQLHASPPPPPTGDPVPASTRLLLQQLGLSGEHEISHLSEELTPPVAKARIDLFRIMIHQDAKAYAYLCFETIRALEASPWARSPAGYETLVHAYTTYSLAIGEALEEPGFADMVASARQAHRLSAHPSLRGQRRTLAATADVAIGTAVRHLQDALTTPSSNTVRNRQLYAQLLAVTDEAAPFGEATNNDDAVNRVWARIDLMKLYQNRGDLASADIEFTVAAKELDDVPELRTGGISLLLPPLLYEARARGLVDGNGYTDDARAILATARTLARYTTTTFQIALTESALLLASPNASDRRSGAALLHNLYTRDISGHQLAKTKRLIAKYGISTHGND